MSGEWLVGCDVVHVLCGSREAYWLLSMCLGLCLWFGRISGVLGVCGVFCCGGFCVSCECPVECSFGCMWVCGCVEGGKVMTCVCALHGCRFKISVWWLCGFCFVFSAWRGLCMVYM